MQIVDYPMSIHPPRILDESDKNRTVETSKLLRQYCLDSGMKVELVPSSIPHKN